MGVSLGDNHEDASLFLVLVKTPMQEFVFMFNLVCWAFQNVRCLYFQLFNGNVRNRWVQSRRRTRGQLKTFRFGFLIFNWIWVIEQSWSKIQFSRQSWEPRKSRNKSDGWEATMWDQSCKLMKLVVVLFTAQFETFLNIILSSIRYCLISWNFHHI